MEVCTLLHVLELTSFPGEAPGEEDGWPTSETRAGYSDSGLSKDTKKEASAFCWPPVMLYNVGKVVYKRVLSKP